MDHPVDRRTGASFPVVMEAGGPISRRRAWSLLSVGGATLMLAACGGGTGLDPLPPQGGGGQAEPPGGAASGNSIGAGAVRVGLILPLSAQGGIGQAAAAMRNAAELAYAEFQNPDITILVKDDGGNEQNARAAAQQALGEGAEIILGPLIAGSVAAVGQVARQANRPVIGFSSDTSVAAPNVYLLSFTPQSDVARIVSYAASRGKRSFAALLPDTPFGTIVAAEFQQQVSALGGRVTTVERYASGQGAQGVRSVAGKLAGSDSLLITDLTDQMAGIARALAGSGISNQQTQLLGTGTWNDASVLSQPAVQGAWFAAPESTGYNSFAQRYRQRFNATPTRLATLSYDAVALVAALVRTQGAARFAPQTLTNASGFAGQDGVFRFRADGTNERALAVLEVANRSARTISPAPRSFGGAAG